jgi:hypothetical protein
LFDDVDFDSLSMCCACGGGSTGGSTGGGAECVTDGVVSASGYPVYGSTTGASDDWSSSCDYTGHESPDLAFEWIPTVTRSYRLSTDGSDFDTVLSIYAADCSTELYCDDDGGAEIEGSFGRTSEVEATFTGGTTYIVVVQGVTSSAYGSVTLSITPGS